MTGDGMKERQFPRARLDCLSREFGEEVLVYDLQRDVGHCLNSTAAATWKLCDGNNSPSQITRTLSRQLSARVDESVVRLALDLLANANLLVEPKVPVEYLSRRAVVDLGIFPVQPRSPSSDPRHDRSPAPLPSGDSWDALFCVLAQPPSASLPRPLWNVAERRDAVAIPAFCALLLAVQLRYKHRPERRSAQSPSLPS